MSFRFENLLLFILYIFALTDIYASRLDAMWEFTASSLAKEFIL